MNVTIPEPAKTTLVGQVIVGQCRVGQVTAGDTWTDQLLGLDGGDGILTTTNGILLSAVDSALALDGDSGQLKISPPTLISDDQPLALLDGTAELIIVQPANVTVQVEVTGNLDLPPDDGNLVAQKNITVVVEDTGSLEFLPDTATTHLDCIIKEDIGGQLLCSPIRLVGQYLVGHLFSGQRWSKYELSLVGGDGQLVVTVNPSLVATDEPLLLAVTSADVHFDFTLVAVDTSTVLELDGGEGIVNPVLTESECDDIDLDEVACLPADPLALACESSDWTASAVEPYDPDPAPTTEIDLDDLVCLEA